MGKMGRLRTEARAARWDERMRELVEAIRSASPSYQHRTTLRLTLDEIDALLDVVDAARAVERSESVGQPSVDPRALKRLRDALGRLEG